MPVGERRLLAELGLAAIERVGIPGARHLDVEGAADSRKHSERPMLAMGVVRRAPTPFRAVRAIAPLEVLQRGSECGGEHLPARLPRRRCAVIAPVAAGGPTLEQAQ